MGQPSSSAWALAPVGKGLVVAGQKTTALVISLHLHKPACADIFAASHLLPECYQPQPPRASISPRGCMAEPIAWFTSTHMNAVFFPSKSPTFCHFTPGNKPIFPDLRSQVGLCWLHLPGEEYRRAGMGPGLSP